MMTNGNKVLAREIMTQVRNDFTASKHKLICYWSDNLWITVTYQTLESIKRKQVEKYHKAVEGKKEEIECNPYTIFHQAVENCKPVVGLASIQKGGKFYQVRSFFITWKLYVSNKSAVWYRRSEHYWVCNVNDYNLHLGARPSYGQPASLPCYEVDDHRVQGQQAPAHTHVRETLPGAAGGLCEGRQRHQEEVWVTQDGRSQQSLRPLPLVVEQPWVTVGVESERGTSGL